MTSRRGRARIRAEIRIEGGNVAQAHDNVPHDQRAEPDAKKRRRSRVFSTFRELRHPEADRYCERPKSGACLTLQGGRSIRWNGMHRRWIWGFTLIASAWGCDASLGDPDAVPAEVRAELARLREQVVLLRDLGRAR